MRMKKTGSDEVVKKEDTLTESSEVWCSEKRKILSFRPLKGFIRHSFDDKGKMYSYALELAEAGYRLT
ncbi:MAG: hypothetical protein IJ072_04630 [Oscillospiraceae bacterium]|nr:hypothetical protein [Oscillospiraceae bacterium]